LWIGESRDQDNWEFGTTGTAASANSTPDVPGISDVGDQHAQGRIVREQGERRLAILRLKDRVSSVNQEARYDTADIVVIVNHEQLYPILRFPPILPAAHTMASHAESSGIATLTNDDR
jgi:hypothetical protein